VLSRRPAVVWRLLDQGYSHTTALGSTEFTILAGFPLSVWGADELRRYLYRSRVGNSRRPPWRMM
jgi:hypothetical protein